MWWGQGVGCIANVLASQAGGPVFDFQHPCNKSAGLIVWLNFCVGIEAGWSLRLSGHSVSLKWWDPGQWETKPSRISANSGLRATAKVDLRLHGHSRLVHPPALKHTLCAFQMISHIPMCLSLYFSSCKLKIQDLFCAFFFKCWSEHLSTFVFYGKSWMFQWHFKK